MSRTRWIDLGNEENDITQAMEIAFLREDAESNNILLNKKIDVITSAIAALVFNQNIHGIGSAPSTVPLSASNSPIGGGDTPFAGGAIPFNASSSFAGAGGSSLLIPQRNFFDGIKGKVIKEFIALNPSYEDFNKDWTTNPLSINVSQGGNVDLKYFKIKDESTFIGRLTKQIRAGVTKPSFGGKFKMDKDYIAFLHPLVSYVNSGGNATFLEIVDAAFNTSPSVAASLRLELLDLGTLTMKEVIALILFVKWRPLLFEETVLAIASIPLKFYGYGTVVDTINNYILLVEKALMGRPFLTKLGKELVKHWDPVYSKWKSHIMEGLTDKSIDSWDTLFDYMREKAMKSSEA